MKSYLWFLAGFALSIVLTTGTILILITLPSRLIPTAPPPRASFVPPAEPGLPLEGRAEAHLYDMEIASGSLSAALDASIAEGFFSSIVARELTRMGEEGGLPVRIESPRIDLQEDAFRLTARVAGKNFQAQGARRIPGDISIAVHDVVSFEGGYRARMELDLGEDVANSLVESQLSRIQSMEELPLRLESLRLAFRQEGLMAVARLDAGALAVDVSIRAKVAVEAGKPKITVEELDLGVVSLPSSLVDQLNSMIERGVTSMETRNLPFQILDITLSEGRMNLLIQVTLAQK
ncbi:MAG: hypothetical protein V3S82_10455 [Dehalococcoidia bacterium]